MSEEIFIKPEQKEVLLEALEKKEETINPEATPKPKRVKKVIDETTRALLTDKLIKSRKIKDLNTETANLKKEIEELKNKKEEASVKEEPIVKQEPVTKKKVVKKAKENPQEDVKKPAVVPDVPKPTVVNTVPPKVVYSTIKMPIW
jgi:hypothetical protein